MALQEGSQLYLLEKLDMDGRIKTLWKECLAGKSLLRSLHNIYLSGRAYDGRGIDFGAKDATSSYYRFLRLDRKAMVFTDLYTQNPSTVVSIDFEEEFDRSEQPFDRAGNELA